MKLPQFVKLEGLISTTLGFSALVACVLPFVLCPHSGIRRVLQVVLSCIGKNSIYDPQHL
jgi:hypothetical protein